MAKRKASRSFEGQKVRVKEGVVMPEFESIAIQGWTGTIVEAGAGEAPQLIVEWDADSMAKMPSSYQTHCDSQGLYAGMACLPFADVEIL
ncbi:MAG: hypothetical protein DWH91_13940 [Planctomycetota bacterium]|nr:MAG: hypothetical protein DWH91_13940 [Planctomycetota bacterium]